MKFYVLPVDPSITQIDLLEPKTQIFQGEIPDISSFLSQDDSNSDAFLVPHDASDWTKKYRGFVASAQREKFTVFFNRSDWPRIVKFQNAISVQYSFSREIRMFQFISPYNVQSFGHLPYRSLSIQPTVSFVGYIPRQTLGRIGKGLLRSPRNPLQSNGALIRKRALKHIRRLPSNIVVENSFYGGARSLIADVKAFRQSYLNSIQESDFVFCPRGDANSSQRFYEVISAGRIPIVPDSSIKFPFCVTDSSYLSVKTFSSDLNRRISSLWRKFDEEKYVDIQYTLRTLFESKLRYDTFFKNFFSQKSIDEMTSESQLP